MRSGNERHAADTWCTGKGFEAAWAHFRPSKPCVSLSTDGNFYLKKSFVGMLYCDMVKIEKVGLKGGNKMWFISALLSAVFAALTSILAKVGIDGVNSNLATAIRTFVVLINERPCHEAQLLQNVQAYPCAVYPAGRRDRGRDPAEPFPADKRRRRAQAAVRPCRTGGSGRRGRCRRFLIKS